MHPKFAFALAGAATLALGLASVARADDPSPAPNALPTPQNAISVAGSTTLADLARAAAEAYRQRFPGVNVAVSGGGSGPALRALGTGSVDVAATDFPPPAGTFIDHRVAVLPFAIVANPATGVTTLTREQLRDALLGKVTNWKDVGGADRAIVFVGRSARSGVTRLLASKVLDGSAPLEGATVDQATGSALAAVRAAPGGFTVAAVSAARASGLAIVAIDGAPPDDAHVVDGTYPLWAYEHMVTAGAPTTAVSRYLGVLESDRDLLHRFGFIGVRELGAGALTP